MRKSSMPSHIDVYRLLIDQVSALVQETARALADGAEDRVRVEEDLFIVLKAHCESKAETLTKFAKGTAKAAKRSRTNRGRQGVTTESAA
jgi:hypothetical protein